MFVAELGLPVAHTGVAGVAVFLEIVMSYDRGTSFVLSTCAEGIVYHISTDHMKMRE
jgi:hypothetical protein